MVFFSGSTPLCPKNGKWAESSRKKGNPITFRECRDARFFKLLYLLPCFNFLTYSELMLLVTLL